MAISYGDCPAPAASLPSHKSALPVIEVQNADQVVAVTPPNESEPEILWFVVVALVEVLLVKTPVDGVVAPMAEESIGVLVIVAPFNVMVSGICASVADPVRSAKLMPNVEVATWTMVFAAPPMNVPNCAIVESPVPPRVAGSVPVVSERAIPSVDVADGAYTPPAVPRSTCPKVGVAVEPVTPRDCCNVLVVSEISMFSDDVASCCHPPPA